MEAMLEGNDKTDGYKERTADRPEIVKHFLSIPSHPHRSCLGTSSARTSRTPTMKPTAISNLLSTALAVGTVLADSFAWERLDKDKAVRPPSGARTLPMADKGVGSARSRYSRRPVHAGSGLGCNSVQELHRRIRGYRRGFWTADDHDNLGTVRPQRTDPPGNSRSPSEGASHRAPRRD